MHIKLISFVKKKISPPYCSDTKQLKFNNNNTKHSIHTDSGF